MRVEAMTRRANWETMLAAGPQSSLQQGWAYGDAAAGAGREVLRLLVRGVDGSPLALVQILRRRLVGRFGVGAIMRGPYWLKPPAPGEEAALIALLRAECPRTALLWSPDDADGADRRAGAGRVMTGQSTVWLELSASAEALLRNLDGKWRNMLRRAERADFGLKTARGGSSLDWLIDANEAHRRRVGYRGPSPDFLRMLAAAEAPPGPLVLVATERTEPVAGVLMVRHGSTATYLAGCTSPRGRELRAHHRLLFEAMRRLADEGVRRLDLGGVETHGSPGIVRFKLGTGGRLATLAGTYLVPPRF